MLEILLNMFDCAGTGRSGIVETWSKLVLRAAQEVSLTVFLHEIRARKDETIVERSRTCASSSLERNRLKIPTPSERCSRRL